MTGVLVHAVNLMSNHHHMVVTDVRGVLPIFLRELHRSVAKAINASQGQWENLWSAEQTNCVLLGDDQDLVRKIAYVVTNPVDAGLVKDPKDWPGVNLWGEQILEVSRPETYFDPLGKSPKHLKLSIQEPPACGVSAMAVGTWRHALSLEINQRISDAHRSMRAAGREFLGKDAALAASFIDKASTYEVKRELTPRVAAVDIELRVTLLQQLRRFYAAYKAALTDWQLGARNVVFPTGTWWMRVHHAANVAPYPATG